MSLAAQAPLDLVFPRRKAMGRDDFIETAANADAAALVSAWRRWPEGRLALIGPKGGGKSHLAHVFTLESGAASRSATGLRAEDAPRLLASGAVVVEDVDRLAEAKEPDRVEAGLFHLLNLAAAEGGRVLLTGVEPPARWPARLPDLASRLQALTVARLSPPDDALLAAVIAKQLEDRGLRFEPGLPSYLAARIERSFAAARAAVEALDAASLAERRPITRRLAAMLGW